MKDELFDGAIERAQRLFSPEEVNFYPYIGQDYDSAPVKILILGESHYGDRDNPVSGDSYHAMSIDVIVNSFLRKGDIKCYAKQNKMLTLGSSSKSLWNKICFYNYFQRLVAPTPKSHVWLEQDETSFKKQAEDAFFHHILPKLSPHIVFVWGAYLRGKMPPLPSKPFFFQLYHPSSVGDWDHDLPQVVNRWENLIESNFPAVKDMMKVEWLYRAIHNEFKGTFAYGMAENVFKARLYPYEKGRYNARSANVMNIEVNFGVNEVKILFYTKNRSLKNAILLSEKIFQESNICEGDCVVLWNKVGYICIDDVVPIVWNYMKRILDFRNEQLGHC